LAALEIDDVSKNSVEIANQSGELLGKITPEIQKTSDLVQEISASSTEMSNGADQINNAVQQLNKVVQQNAANAEEMAATSEELNGQAIRLKDISSYFKIDERGGLGQNRNVQRAAPVRNFTTQKVEREQPAKREKTHKRADDIKGVDIDLSSNQDKSIDDEYEKF